MLDGNFIPKRASWYGSFWECIIGLTKQALKNTRKGICHIESTRDNYSTDQSNANQLLTYVLPDLRN